MGHTEIDLGKSFSNRLKMQTFIIDWKMFSEYITESSSLSKRLSVLIILNRLVVYILYMHLHMTLGTAPECVNGRSASKMHLNV